MIPVCLARSIRVGGILWSAGPSFWGEQRDLRQHVESGGASLTFRGVCQIQQRFRTSMRAATRLQDVCYLVLVQCYFARQE